MQIEVAGVGDAGEILDLQKLAYQSEAAIYGDFAIPPLVQSLEDMEADFRKEVFLKATVDGRIVGSVRGHMQEGTCHIGRLIVRPEFQNRGVGTSLMRAIEVHFTDARRYELFTGDRSERNLHLYRKLGYRAFRTTALTDLVTIVHLEKVVGEGRGI